MKIVVDSLPNSSDDCIFKLDVPYRSAGDYLVNRSHCLLANPYASHVNLSVPEGASLSGECFLSLELACPYLTEVSCSCHK